jgi:hypothetical protein
MEGMRWTYALVACVAACHGGSGGPSDAKATADAATVDAIADAGPPDGRYDADPKTIHFGDYTVAVPLDVQGLAGIHVITGTLTVTANMSSLSLPDLEEVGVDVIFNASQITSVSLPNLWRVGGQMQVGTAATSLSLPSLTEVGLDFNGGFSAGYALTDLELPRLQRVANGFYVASDPLVTLSAPALTTIGGQFSAGNSHLQTLDLRSLTHAGAFMLGTDDTLTSLTGLGKLATVTGTLELVNISQPTSLDGLSSLTSVGNLELQMGKLTDVSALSSLTTVSGHLYIQFCPALTNLHGLEHLTQVGGELMLDDDARLTDLSGLDPLVSVGDLFITNNAALVTNGFPHLTTTTSGFYVHANPQLTSLGLAALANAKGGTVTDNPLLPTCEATGLRDRLVANGASSAAFMISGNGTGTCP